MVAGVEMDIVGTTTGLTVIVIDTLVTIPGVAHAALLVSVHIIISPLEGTYEYELPVPILTPSTFH